MPASESSLKARVNLADPAQARLCVSVGRSMEPTLHGQELLDLVPLAPETVRPGDVILFRSSRAAELVVHRVVAVTAAGLRTRGDNNATEDPAPVQPADITGRVVAASRGQRRILIHGGWRGRWIAWRVRAVKRALRLTAPVLRYPYRLLRASGVVARLCPRRWRPRVVKTEAGGFPALRLFAGARVAGSYDAAAGEWIVRRPYDLLVRPRDLPARSN